MTATVAKLRRVVATPPDLLALHVCSMLLSRRCREHNYWKVLYSHEVPLDPAVEPIVILSTEGQQELFAEWRGKSWSIQFVGRA